MEMIKFTAPIEIINDISLVRVPSEISSQFPSRGLVMAEATWNGVPLPTPLEPDGGGSHWLEVPESVGQKAGDHVSILLKIMERWTPPPLPKDLGEALETGGFLEFWFTLTVKAQWEWIRWVRATANPETRRKRIGVALSKMSAGDRRPCCFDASRCSVPQVSKNGVLLTP